MSDEQALCDAVHRLCVWSRTRRRLLRLGAQRPRRSRSGPPTYGPCCDTAFPRAGAVLAASGIALRASGDDGADLHLGLVDVAGAEQGVASPPARTTRSGPEPGR